MDKMIAKKFDSGTSLTDVFNFVQPLQSIGRLHKLGGDCHQKLKSRKGAALVISIFLAMTATMMVMTMMTMSQANMQQITDNRSGMLAYYAAEAGMEDVRNYFNKYNSDMGVSLGGLGLPVEGSPETLGNNAQYWINSVTYQDSNQTAIVDIIGVFGNASRKIRVKYSEMLPSTFDDYGLLTDGALSVNGDKILKMSIHGNDGINLTGENITENNAVASQSSDPTADDPHPSLNPVGGYEPAVEVPLVPVDDLRTTSQDDGILLDSSQADLMDQINAAAADSKIYISGTFGKNKNQIGTDTITLSGDMEGKLLFFDGDITVEANGLEDLANITLVSSGSIVINGSIDIGTSHEGYMDVIFACDNDIELNGSRTFEAMFWTNDSFTQNGSSMSGKVMSQTGLNFNGNYILDSSNDVYNTGLLDTIVGLVSWQLVPMDG